MEELRLLEEIFGNEQGLVVFDIGACNFNESRQFKETLNADVYAFEPDKDNIEAHREAAEKAGVRVFPIALSDEDSETIFYPSDNLDGNTWRYSGSLIKPVVKEGTSEGVFHHGLIYNLDGYRVITKRFDTFCKENNIMKVDFVHIDVQGAETKVLSALGEYRPRLIFAETCEFETYETGTTLEEFDYFMSQLGYEIKQRYLYDTAYILKDAN